ncbi:FAD-binding protein, partial [Acinetobacter baumannii]
MAAVIDAVRAEPRIDLLRGEARALLKDANGRVAGALLARGGGALVEIRAGAVILATGGVGGLYATTTDPAEVRGQGLALAALAGATI